MSNSVRSISLFDLDHTLFKVNSSFRFGIHLYKRKLLSSKKMLFLMGCYGLHRLGMMDPSTLNQNAARTFFIGQSLPFLDKIVLEFLAEEFSVMLNLLVVQCLLDAKARGDYIVILSSSPDFIVRRVAEKFGVDEWAATQYSISKDKIITGIANTMEGRDKAEFVIRSIEKYGMSKKNVFGYTDSHLDTPFLEAVGVPIAVNPDKILKRTCRKRGWQCL